jgi:hypothetical protein
MVESPVVGIGSRLVGLGAAGEATVLLLDLLDDENIMLEGFLVEWELTRLAKGLGTAGVVANKRFFVEMDVHMLFEVLAERKLLRTEGAGKAAVLHVRGEVAA